MNQALKQGDIVIVYDSTSNDMYRGIVITDEYVGLQVYVDTLKNGSVQQNYYSRQFVMKIF